MFPGGFVDGDKNPECLWAFEDVVEKMGKAANREDNNNADPGEQYLIHIYPLSFGVKFGEFFGFLI